MTSVEFLLARITAKSQGLKPRLPGGAIPELTAEDVAMAAGQVTNKHAYNAMMAKYCQDDIATERILEHIKRYGWLMWFDRNRPARTAVSAHNRIAELAVLYHLNKAVGEKRTDRVCALFCGCSRKTWVSNYRTHYEGLTTYLAGLDSEATAQVHRALK